MPWLHIFWGTYLATLQVSIQYYKINKLMWKVNNFLCQAPSIIECGCLVAGFLMCCFLHLQFVKYVV